MSSTDSHTRILEAALGLFKKRAAFSMSEIAKAAGLSRQAVYLHFADRGELLVQAARYADEKRGLRDALQEVVDAPSGCEAMRRYVALQARMNPGIWGLARVVDGARRTDREIERAWQDRLDARLMICRSIITRVAEDPGLRAGLSEEIAADLMWTVTSLRMWEDLVLGRKWTPQRYEQHLVALLEQALLPKPQATLAP